MRAATTAAAVLPTPCTIMVRSAEGCVCSRSGLISRPTACVAGASVISCAAAAALLRVAERVADAVPSPACSEPRAPLPHPPPPLPLPPPDSASPSPLTPSTTAHLSDKTALCRNGGSPRGAAPMVGRASACDPRAHAIGYRCARHRARPRCDTAPSHCCMQRSRTVNMCFCATTNAPSGGGSVPPVKPSKPSTARMHGQWSGPYCMHN